MSEGDKKPDLKDDDEGARDDDAAADALARAAGGDIVKAGPGDETTAEAEKSALLAAEAIAAEELARQGEDGETPNQLGTQRFVYAAYMAGALLVTFVLAKGINVGWYRLGQWKPQFGEPQDELIFPISAVVGAAVAVYYWRRTRARELAEDVANELSKVTWPSKKEVANNTMVVIVTTTFATVFFALMDRFWSFVTNLVYGT